MDHRARAIAAARATEGQVEDAMDGLPFHVIYLDELPAWKAPHFTAGTVHASDIG
jgi:phage terminase large subunit-like protein